MGAEEFRQELRRMAQINDILAYFNDEKMVAALSSDVDAGARFVNIFRHPIDQKNYLVVTSLATHCIQSGLFSTKIKWSVAHKDLDTVFYQRGTFAGRVTDDLNLLDRKGNKRYFTFGINEPVPSSKVARDIAEKNAKVAEAEIKAQLAGKDAPLAETSSGDPAFDQLQRSLAAAEAGPTPDTEPSDHWTEADYERLQSWMNDCWNASKYDQIWTRRVALGYGLSQRSAPNSVWFWINAWAALSGLKLGHRDHPILSTFAGNAEQAVNSSNTDQKLALGDIKRQFFGS